VGLKDAAEVLDTTTEAVRKRAKRGTLESTAGEDGRLYVRVDGSVDERVDGEFRLVERMASEIDHLREQLKEEREANRENRRIIAGLVQRVPELEPAKDSSSEPPESPVTSSGETDKGKAPEQQEPTQRRSWWRQFFGLE
jgi:hypothetical protein